MSSGPQMIDLEPGSRDGGAYWPTLLGITVSFWSSYSVSLILQQWLCTWRLPLFLSSTLNSFSVSGPPWNLTLVWDKILSQVSSLTQCLSKVIAGYLITECLANFIMATECSNAEPVDSLPHQWDSDDPWRQLSNSKSQSNSIFLWTHFTVTWTELIINAYGYHGNIEDALRVRCREDLS